MAISIQNLGIIIYFMIVIAYYILIIYTNIQIVKRKNKTFWLVLCILSYFIFPLGIIFLIIYWTAGKDVIKDDSLRKAQLKALKRGKVGVQLKGKMRKLK